MSESSLLPAPGFFRRQFGDASTSSQTFFDFAFGIVAPVICLLFDPIVFRGEVIMGANVLLGRYRFLSYGMISLSVAVLVVWLWVGRRIRWLQGIMAGSLWAGGIFALVLGIILTPISLLGLLFVVGIFGFTPYITAFVFFRNAVRAGRFAVSRMNVTTYTVTLLIGFCGLLGTPIAGYIVVQETVSASILDIVVGGPSARLAVLRLKGIRCCFDHDELLRAYERESDGDRRDRIARAYREISGVDLQHRLFELND